MSDIFDDASDLEILQRNTAIKSIQDKKPLEATGHCLYCNEEVKAKERFCTVDCRDDYDFEQRVKHIAGKI